MIGCWKNRLKWRFYPVKFHVKLINLQKPILVQCVVNEGSRLEVVETGDKDCLFPEDRCGTFHITLCAYGQYCTLSKNAGLLSHKKDGDLPLKIESWNFGKMTSSRCLHFSSYLYGHLQIATQVSHLSPVTTPTLRLFYIFYDFSRTVE